MLEEDARNLLTLGQEECSFLVISSLVFEKYS